MKNPVQAAKLLIVEDNPTNREVLENLLQKMGYGFSTVEDGWQAVNTVTTGSRPDLILMDCHMPVMDGFEATQLIRAWEAAQQQPRIPIIAVTAGALDEDRARCFSVGMDEFLTKPLNVQKLSETLSSHLGEEAPGAPSAPALPNALLIPFLFGVVLLSLNNGIMYDNVSQRNAAMGITVLSLLYITYMIVSFVQNDDMELIGYFGLMPALHLYGQ